MVNFKNCLNWVGAIAIATAIAHPVMAKPTLQGAEVKQPNVSYRVYQGYDEDPDYCDLRPIVGWFIWYYDIGGQCTIIQVANEEEAFRRSNELFNHSFSVIVIGFGFKPSMTF